MPKITIPEHVKPILRCLLDSGYEAYVVGGCVRDSLMNREPHDWDITTDARPEDIRACFGKAGYDIVDTGARFGTVTVFTNGCGYEVTTYRIDGVYEDGRHPSEVCFADALAQDLSRRDFTINAMAADVNGDVTDLFGGAKDIERRLIRCVGDASTRFREDALRILRALRFASKLGFEIEAETGLAIHDHKRLLDNVSAERISKELLGILCGENVKGVLTGRCDVIAHIIPELEICIGYNQHNPYHCYTLYEHIASSVANVRADPILRLTMLLHDIGKPFCMTVDDEGKQHYRGHGKVSAELAQKRLRALRFSNDIIDTVVQLVEYHDLFTEPTRRFILRTMNKIGEEQFRRLLEVRRADIDAQSEYNREPRITKLERLEELLDEAIRDQDIFRVKDLAVNGRDLIEAGVPEGKAIGTTLQMLLEAVIDGKVSNERNALLSYWDANNTKI